MEKPIEIDYRDVQPSPAIETAIREKVAKLARFHPHIIGCRVTVEAGHHHHRSGHEYSVHLRIAVPGGTVNVSRDKGQGHEDFYVALRDAFDAARRQLESDAQLRRGEVKAARPASA